MGAPATLVIGPSLGPCCFNVGQEVAESYARRYRDARWCIGYGHRRSAVCGSTCGRLRPGPRPRLGIRSAEHVVNPRLCTACNRDLFYSYRREGPVTGRHACVGWIADA